MPKRLEEDVEFFKCVVCGRYRPVEELKEVFVKNLVFKQDFCKRCYDRLKARREAKVDKDGE